MYEWDSDKRYYMVVDGGKFDIRENSTGSNPSFAILPGFVVRTNFNTLDNGGGIALFGHPDNGYVRIASSAEGVYIQGVDSTQTGSKALWLTGANGLPGWIQTYYNVLDDGTGKMTVKNDVAVSGNATAGSWSPAIAFNSGGNAAYFQKDPDGRFKFYSSGSGFNTEVFVIDSVGGVFTPRNTLDDGTGVAKFGAGTGGTYNGNILFGPADQFTTLQFKSGTTVKTQLLGDMATGNVYLDATNFFFRNAPNSGANVLVIENSGRVATENNVLDDGVGNMSIAGPLFKATGGHDLNIAPYSGKIVGFTDSAVSEWLLRVNDSTGGASTKNNTLDDGNGNMVVNGSVTTNRSNDAWFIARATGFGKYVGIGANSVGLNVSMLDANGNWIVTVLEDNGTTGVLTYRGAPVITSAGGTITGGLTVNNGIFMPNNSSLWGKGTGGDNLPLIHMATNNTVRVGFSTNKVYTYSGHEFITSEGGQAVNGNFAINGILGMGALGGEKLYVYDAGAGGSRLGLGVDMTGNSNELVLFHSTQTGNEGRISFGKRLSTNGVYSETMSLSANGSLAVNYVNAVDLNSTGKIYPASTNGTIASNTGSTGGLEVRSADNTGAAFMTFHRQGSYAAHFGLDTDNKLKIGGWSTGANSYAVWDERYMRDNNGVLEFFTGGAWKPVGGIKSVQRGVAGLGNNVNSYVDIGVSAVNMSKAWVNVLDVRLIEGSNFKLYNYELINSTTIRIRYTIPIGSSTEVPWELVESY
jgi:hypothetical protein